MIVDCDRCAVRGHACHDCAITVLLGVPPEGVELDRTETQALHTLAEAGLIPPLRLVHASIIPRTAPEISRERRSSPDDSSLPLRKAGERLIAGGKRSARRVS